MHLGQNILDCYNFELLLRRLFNRPFPSYLKPLLQSKAWCTIIHMKMSFICMWMKSHFHMKGRAPRLALRKRLKVICTSVVIIFCNRTLCHPILPVSLIVIKQMEHLILFYWIGHLSVLLPLLTLYTHPTEHLLWLQCRLSPQKRRMTKSAVYRDLQSAAWRPWACSSTE